MAAYASHRKHTTRVYIITIPIIANQALRVCPTSIKQVKVTRYKDVRIEFKKFEIKTLR